jgi:uncharacterized protein (UPF0332 family)
MTGFRSAPDILNAMLAKAGEKLVAARRDFADGFYGEVSSRAYYAVFHAISAVLASRGMTFSSHAQVIGAFNKEFVKTAVFSADTTRKLQRLFEDRQISDYDCTGKIDEETAREDLDDAQALVDICRNYLKTV